MDGQRRREVSVSRDLPPWALGPALPRRSRRRTLGNAPAGESGPGELPPGEHVPLKPCTDGAFMSTWRSRTIG